MKLRLNLATTPLENNRRFILAAVLLGTVALGALLVLSSQTYRNLRETRGRRNEIARLERESRQYRLERRELEEFFKNPDTRRWMERAGFLNDLIEQRSFPWTKVFQDLERRLPVGVRVVSIAPRMYAGRVEVKLMVGAVSDEGKLKFLQSLVDSPEFSRVQVLSESRPERPDQGDRVLLELLAWYQGGSGAQER